MEIRTSCPECGSVNCKKNGHIHCNGKQNNLCNDCGRQFVAEFEQRIVSDDDRNRVKRLLAERVSLRGICRVIGVGMKWLMGFIEECYNEAPEDLHARVPESASPVVFRRVKAEADELLSFVQNKANKQWLWLAIDANTSEAIAYYVGDRSKDSARAFWDKIPPVYQESATFFTDGYAGYKGVIPEARHRVVTKASRLTNHVERLNCTLRQRVSRLVRSTLSFSKKLENHIGAIRYFLCQYNLELIRA